jgi:hypothetical protein
MSGRKYVINQNKQQTPTSTYVSFFSLFNEQKKLNIMFIIYMCRRIVTIRASCIASHFLSDAMHKVKIRLIIDMIIC